MEIRPTQTAEGAISTSLVLQGLREMRIAELACRRAGLHSVVETLLWQQADDPIGPAPSEGQKAILRHPQEAATREHLKTADFTVSFDIQQKVLDALTGLADSRPCTRPIARRRARAMLNAAGVDWRNPHAD